MWEDVEQAESLSASYFNNFPFLALKIRSICFDAAERYTFYRIGMLIYLK